MRWMRMTKPQRDSGDCRCNHLRWMRMTEPQRDRLSLQYCLMQSCHPEGHLLNTETRAQDEGSPCGSLSQAYMLAREYPCKKYRPPGGSEEEIPQERFSSSFLGISFGMTGLCMSFVTLSLSVTCAATSPGVRGLLILPKEKARPLGELRESGERAKQKRQLNESEGVEKTTSIGRKLPF